MNETIRILICDDHPIVREGLRGLIASEPGMEVVGEASDGVEAVEQALRLEPDVILLDLVMPRKDGIAAIGDILRQQPAARVLVITSFVEDERLLPAIRAGARGYLLKDSSAEDLLDAVRQVHRGAAMLHPLVARKLVQEVREPREPRSTLPQLTGRELEVVKLVAQGLSNQEIAAQLVLSERTVRTYVSSIVRKLQVGSRTQAALYALRQGLAELDENSQDSTGSP